MSILLCPVCEHPISQHFEHGCFTEIDSTHLCQCTAPKQVLQLYQETFNNLELLRAHYAIVLRALRIYADDDNWGITSPLIFVKQYDGVNGAYGGFEAQQALKAVGLGGDTPTKR